MGLKQGGKDGGNLQASEEAAVWLQRLREHDTPEVRAEFSAWVRKGAVNLEEFLFAQATWKELDYVDPDMRKRLWSVEGPETVVDFPVRERLQRRRAVGKSTAPKPAPLVADFGGSDAGRRHDRLGDAHHLPYARYRYW